MSLHRYFLAVAGGVALLAAGGIEAADPYSQPPPILEPLPEIPPPDADVTNATPQVTVKQRDRDTVEEARVNGNIIWIKVTPRYGGRPYYLIPTGGGNMYIRRDSLDTALKPPMWVLFSW